MINSISVRRRASKSVSIDAGKAALIVAIVATAIFFTAILLQSETFAYLCGVVAFAAIYYSENDNKINPEEI